VGGNSAPQTLEVSQVTKHEHERLKPG
jgi:hypothetical protein